MFHAEQIRVNAKENGKFTLRFAFAWKVVKTSNRDAPELKVGTIYKPMKLKRKSVCFFSRSMLRYKQWKPSSDDKSMTAIVAGASCLRPEHTEDETWITYLPFLERIAFQFPRSTWYLAMFSFRRVHNGKKSNVNHATQMSLFSTCHTGYHCHNEMLSIFWVICCDQTSRKEQQRSVDDTLYWQILQWKWRRS